MLTREMGLKTRMVLIVVLTAGLLAVVGGVLFRALGTTREAYQRVLDRQVEQMEHALRISVAMLSARRAEKDFLARKDLQYVEKVKEYADAVRADAAVIDGIEQQIGHADGRRLTADITAYIQDYQDSFLRLAQAWQARGLDADSGLQGSFRKAAHAVETEIARYPALAVDYLLLRRHEKDYLLRQEAGYVQEVDRVLQRLRGRIPSLAGDPRLAGRLAGALDAYRRDFQALVEQDGRHRPPG